MYCHLLNVNKQFVINDELLEKSNQESGPFLIPIGTTTRGIRNGTGLEFPL